jgi:CDP-6-deoxy-D-xylo-4-hexulose-3-dehydrase
MKKTFPLIQNNINKSDLDQIIRYLMAPSEKIKLTAGKKVRLFEEKWSKWLGTKYSIMVNSGSSANFLTIKYLESKFPKGSEIIVPPFTWNSDIISILDSGFVPIFCDIQLENLGLNPNLIEEKISKKTIAIFLTHAQGFNAITSKIINLCKKYKLYLIEDVCESHGAKFNQKKLGSIGDISNFSFYYAHHMSTIEGGMISTNNKKIYQTIKMMRGHGLLREVGDVKFQKEVINRNKDLNPQFIFQTKGYNMRSTELNAIIGLNQLKSLNKNIKIRNSNHNLFLSLLNPEIFFTNFDLNGSSNYAFNLILKEKNDELMEKIKSNLDKNKIEYRVGSAGGGNQLRQPYLKNLFKKKYHEKFKITEHIHFYGMYIGNHPLLLKKDVKFITSVINNSI